MFYTAFLDTGKLGDSSLAVLTEKSYNAMTANGDVDLRPVSCIFYLTCVRNDITFSYHIYKLSFLNFLLGRQPNGPGQFMFGTIEWEHKTSWMEGVNTEDLNLTEAVNNLDIR